MDMVINGLVKEFYGKNDTCLNYEDIKECFFRILKLSEISRREGLLAFEEQVRKIIYEKLGKEIDISAPDVYDAMNGLSGIDRFFCSLLMLVVDGGVLEHYEQIAVSRYYASNFTGTEALSAIMIIIGLSSIQFGENPKIIEQELFALLPEDYEKRLQGERKEQREMKKKKTGQEEQGIPESFFVERERNAEISPVSKTLSEIMVSLQDDDVRRVLRETDNQELELCLKNMGGSARRKIFSNLSSRLARMIYEDMDVMGDVQGDDVESAAVEMLKRIENLEDVGEIVLKKGVVESIEKAIELRGNSFE